MHALPARPLVAALLAGALVLAPVPGVALPPLIVALGKQMVQQAVTSTMKSLLLGSLSDMGCKGVALSNALQALDGGLPLNKAPAGLAGILPALPGGMQMPVLPGGMSALPAGMPALPADAALDPQTMADLQAMLSQPPLSPADTLAVIDEMSELGLLPRAVQSELKECMLLLPQATPAMGMGMGMLKPMLPQMRQARDEMQALSPAEQDELAGVMADELAALPAAERRSFVDQIEGGFFPPRVSEGVKARLGVR